ncbi:hypothetical protein P7K49_012362, partial [Saguinus oedipus]
MEPTPPVRGAQPTCPWSPLCLPMEHAPPAHGAHPACSWSPARLHMEPSPPVWIPPAMEPTLPIYRVPPPPTCPWSPLLVIAGQVHDLIMEAGAFP